jgi:hypothetical protein
MCCHKFCRPCPKKELFPTESNAGPVSPQIHQRQTRKAIIRSPEAVSSPVAQTVTPATKSRTPARAQVMITGVKSAVPVDASADSVKGDDAPAIVDTASLATTMQPMTVRRAARFLRFM